MNGLQIGDTNITKISGPVSMYYLRPKQEIYDNGGADNFPLFLLFGDIHFSKKDNCNPCYNVDKNSSCYEISDAKFLKQLDTLSSNNLPIDFYTEYWLDTNLIEQNKDGYMYEMINNERLWCYNMYRTDTNFNTFRNTNYCPTNNIRWHLADIRMAGNNMSPDKIDDIATDLLKKINISDKYQNYSYIETQINTILLYFSNKENKSKKFVLENIFNEKNIFKSIDDFKKLLKTLCYINNNNNNNNNKLNIKKFGEILFKNYINENTNSFIFKQIIKQDYIEFKNIKYWRYFYKNSLRKLNIYLNLNIKDIEQLIDKLDIDSDLSEENYKLCGKLMTLITVPFMDIYILCRVFKKPVTKIKHDKRSTLDVRPSLVISYLGDWHIQNIVDILQLTGFYNLEHQINSNNNNNKRCININFKLNLSEQVKNHNNIRNIEINIDKIKKYSKLEYLIKQNIEDVEDIEYVDPGNNYSIYDDNTILFDIGIKYLSLSLLPIVLNYLENKKIKVNSIIICLCFILIDIINPKISFIKQIIIFINKYLLENKINYRDLKDITGLNQEIIINNNTKSKENIASSNDSSVTSLGDAKLENIASSNESSVTSSGELLKENIASSNDPAVTSLGDAKLENIASSNESSVTSSGELLKENIASSNDPAVTSSGDAKLKNIASSNEPSVTSSGDAKESLKKPSVTSLGDAKESLNEPSVTILGDAKESLKKPSVTSLGDAKESLNEPSVTSSGDAKLENKESSNLLSVTNSGDKKSKKKNKKNKIDPIENQLLNPIKNQLLGGMISSVDNIFSANLINKDIKYIIKKIIVIFTEYFGKENRTLDDFRNIIKKNLNIDNDLNNINDKKQIFKENILKHELSPDEIIDITNSKYLEAYNKLKNTIPYKLSSLIDNKVISIIKKIEYNKQLIDKKSNMIFEYSNAIKNVNLNEICDNIDFDKNNINETTIDNCLTNYKKLIKEKRNNIKEIKIILDNIIF